MRDEEKGVTTSTEPSLTAATVSVGHVSEEAETQDEESEGSRGRGEDRPHDVEEASGITCTRDDGERRKEGEREGQQVRSARGEPAGDRPRQLTLSLSCREEIDGRLCRDILIDPGASSNFVRRDWAQGCRLREETLRVPLTVKLAVGQLSSRLMGGVAVKSMEVHGSSAPCTLIAMEQLSHAVILGMPWLKRAGVDLGLREPMTWNRRPICVQTSGRATVVHSMKVDPDYAAVMAGMLSRHPRAFSKELRKRAADENPNALQCRVTLKDPNCKPACSKQRRRSPKDTQTLIGCVKEMEEAGLITRSESPWSSQPVLVKKMRDGVVLDEKRPCWDYRWVNERIVSDAHPLPLPEDMFDKLQGHRLFSKMDLTKGFWQIPLEKASRAVLAMDTPLGLYEPTTMPFGMKNAPAVFQREMQRVLKERLYQGVMVFIDDILIYSKTADEHAKLVEWVLTRLEAEGYYAHPDKCEFFQREVSFLGHVVSEQGVAVQQHKVKAVTEWPVPTTKKQVRAFLGLCNYYRRFIPAFSGIAAPMTDLTGKDVPFQWTERQQSAFELLKRRMTTADVLAHPHQERPYIITTDASGFAISGVLSQDQPDSTRRPVAYMSRKMSPAERRYATHDKELLAIVRAVEHWRCYLEGSAHPIQLLSDHRSLQHLNTQPSLNDRQARWVEKLSNFDFRISYLKGSLNRVADELSRRADYEAEASAERATENAANRHDEPPRVRLICTEVVDPTTTTTTTTNTNTMTTTNTTTIATTATEPTNDDDTKEDEVRPIWQISMDGFPLLDDIKEAAKRDEVYQQQLAQPHPRTDGLTVGERLVVDL